MKHPLIFDGHNDLLLQIQCGSVSAGEAGFMGAGGRHVDLIKARTGGFAGGFFAIFVPDSGDASFLEEMMPESYDLPLPPAVAWPQAMQTALAQAATLISLERQGALKICRSASDVRSAMETGVMAAVMHMEGAEAIDPDFETLEVLHAAGLRSLGPVWSRPTIYGHGVPFRFPSGPDTGPGLTADGLRLVKKCNEMNILVDLSHLNEAGFWDVARHSTKPLVATHSNAHALCPHSRNLTDRQLHAIRDSDGIVGLNFAVAFLRKDGRMKADTPLARMLEHLDYLIDILGEDRVGLGSDFDGATVPDAIKDVAGLPALRKAMQTHGYGRELMAKLCHGNWLRVLEQTLG
ncbi:dipeptidase [Leisingera daeponensis]|uniref:Dipeptidase n=1 Tax=Leisingera daeponensis TaxID=405746 RepID=A0ABS7NE15_9RHOB|nr:dipeptidase [Leisingera daeponensis]MBY6138336.1 dipeptidase [Leisingera daeponensis]